MIDRRLRQGRFLVVAGSLIIAFAVRAVLLLQHPPALFASNDNTWYAAVARSLATGHGVTLPAVTGGRVWTFRFPPGYPTVLALGQHVLFWVRPTDADLWTSAALGAAAAAFVAAVAWRVADRGAPRTQLIVAGGAGLFFAVNPLLAGASVSLMAESLYVLVVAAALLLVDRIVAGSQLGLDAALLGVVIGVGALTRSEGFVVRGAITLGGLLVARRRKAASRPFVIALAIGLVFPVAWSLVATAQAHRPVVVATNSGSLVLGANCSATAHGSAAGFWDYTCLGGTDGRLSADARSMLGAVNRSAAQNPFTPAPVAGPSIDAQLNRAQLSEALHRVTHAPADFVRAVPYRALRGLGVYWTADQDRLEYFEGRNHHWELAGRWFHVLLVLPLTAVALVAMARRRIRSGRRLRAIVHVDRLLPAAVSLGAVFLIVLLTYGSTRFRAAAEPALAVLAAAGAALLLMRRSNVSEPAQ